MRRHVCQACGSAPAYVGELTAWGFCESCLEAGGPGMDDLLTAPQVCEIMGVKESSWRKNQSTWRRMDPGDPRRGPLPVGAVTNEGGRPVHGWRRDEVLAWKAAQKERRSLLGRRAPTDKCPVCSRFVKIGVECSHGKPADG